MSVIYAQLIGVRTIYRRTDSTVSVFECRFCGVSFLFSFCSTFRRWTFLGRRPFKLCGCFSRHKYSRLGVLYDFIVLG